MSTQQTKYPYVVQPGDELLSLIDIEKYKANAKVTSNKKSSLRLQIDVASLGTSLSLVMLIFTLIGAALASGMWDENSNQFIYFVVLEFILLFGFATFKFKAEAKMAEITWIDEKVLELIDTDPELCGQLAQWVADYPYVKSYVQKIAALDRLPTFAEFMFIENWVQDDVKKKPINDLKTALNLKTS